MITARRLQTSFHNEPSDLIYRSVDFELQEQDINSNRESNSISELPSAPGEESVSHASISGHNPNIKQVEDDSVNQSTAIERHMRSPSLTHALSRVWESIGGVNTQFECPVCFELMRPPVNVFQCRQGHVVCKVHVIFATLH